MIKLETTEQRRKIMRAIKSKNTTVEIILAKALWHKGYRYRKNDKTIFGTPDLVFKKYKIAIFIDSEFFHGFNWEAKKDKIKNNRDYWVAKIEKNIARDQKVNEYLISKGWTVLRFWCSEINKNLRECIKVIENEINDKHARIYFLK
ncbi:very short patch repair endonuclease [Flavobacterium sp. RHBU_24]|uniref:very short patch repair endonuclease n=1 Tax=Flavobacterium sp. RHBU_24 TaxID=3391185 RepID=UPI00398563A7